MDDKAGAIVGSGLIEVNPSFLGDQKSCDRLSNTLSFHAILNSHTIGRDGIRPLLCCNDGALPCTTPAPLAAWRTDYNTERPYSRLGWQTPAKFA